MDKETKDLLKALSKPCSNKQYGGFYAIIFIGLLLIVGTIWLTWFLGKHIYNYIRNKRIAPKSVRVKQHSNQIREEVDKHEQMLHDFSVLEEAIWKNKFNLYYAIRSYKNTDTELIQYVDFYIPIDNRFVNVSELTYNYVKSNIEDPCKWKINYDMTLYNGRSKNLKGSVVFTGLGMLRLEKVLHKLFGTTISLVQTEVDLTGDDYVHYNILQKQ